VDLPPNDYVDVVVRFAPQDWTVRAGHRLGLIMASSNAAWAVPPGTRRTVRVENDRSRLELPVAGAVTIP
jgi:X-Pro dipeptidyl-peptidase